MASATLTLIGMYNWDETLFDNLVLPNEIDKDLFIDTLLLKAGEFEVLYTNPDFMKRAVGVWSNKWYRTFSEWLRGTQATWNPIYNYDRFEDVEDQHTKSYGYTDSAEYDEDRTYNLTDKRTANLENKRTANLQDKRTADLSEERTANLSDQRIAGLTTQRTADLADAITHGTTGTTSQTVAGTTQHDVSAYDQSGYTPSSKDTINNGTTQNTMMGTDTTTHTGTDTTTESGTDTTNHTGTDTVKNTGTDTTNLTGTDTNATTGTDTNTKTGTDKFHVEGKKQDVSGTESNGNWHKGHIYGNVGITQSADMLRNFYDIATWNLYDHMADTFTNELLIPVY